MPINPRSDPKHHVTWQPVAEWRQGGQLRRDANRVQAGEYPQLPVHDEGIQSIKYQNKFKKSMQQKIFGTGAGMGRSCTSIDKQPGKVGISQMMILSDEKNKP